MRAITPRALGAIVVAAVSVLCGLGAGTAAAVPGPPHHIAVPAGIGTGRVMVLRPHRLDLFNGGRHTRSVYLNGQSATLSGLAVAVADDAFLSRDGQTMRVRGALIQRPLTNLDVGGAGVGAVRLISDRGSPAFLSGSRATVTFHGVNVTGVALSVRDARPYVSYSGFSDVSATSSTFTHLGRSGKRPVAALQVGRGTTLSASNVSFSDDVVALAAANTSAVRLSAVAVSRSALDGIVLRNAGVVTASNLTVHANGRDGLVLAGPRTQLTSTGQLTATANRRFGILMSEAVSAHVKNAHTQSNGLAGVNVHDVGVSSVVGQVSSNEPVALRVDSAEKFSADGLAASNDETGMSATAKSRNLHLHAITVTGARTGLRLDSGGVTADAITVTGSGTGLLIGPAADHARITGLRVSSPAVSNPATVGAVVSGAGTLLTDSRIEGPSIGVEIRGRDATVSGGSISGKRIGVAVRNDADQSTVSHVTISGGIIGVSAVARGRLALVNVEITGSQRAALRAGGGTTTVTASTLTSAGTAVQAYAPVTVAQSSVAGVVGAHVASGVAAQFTDDQIVGSRTGIRIVNGGHVRVTSSRVTGLTPISGIAAVLGLSFIGPLPLHWLGASGLALLVIALFLLALSRSRERGHERLVLAPVHVTNRR